MHLVESTPLPDLPDITQPYDPEQPRTHQLMLPGKKKNDPRLFLIHDRGSEVVAQRMPSLSPFRRLIRFCSQSSRSLDCNLCIKMSSAYQSSAPSGRKRKTHEILLPQIYTSSALSNSQLFFSSHLSNLAIIPLISDRGRGGKHKATTNYDSHER